MKLTFDFYSANSKRSPPLIDEEEIYTQEYQDPTAKKLMLLYL